MENTENPSMSYEKQLEVMQYLEKFSGVFNDMMSEVVQRIMRSQFDTEIMPSAQQEAPDLRETIPSVRIDPQQFVQQQLEFLNKQQLLWQNAARSMLGQTVEPIVSEEKDDKRFADGDWQGNPVFSYIKQAYLLNAEYMHKLVDALQFDDKKVEEQVRFYTRQFINSMAPSNYIFTNPEVFREILESEGKNLAKGIDNFIRDLENSPNEAFKITQVKLDAFTLGKDLAYTPGEVVYQNRLIQLIQYAPSTTEVYKLPLLIIPPFINKYYILDLDAKKSLVRWLVAQGFTVFMISWINPGDSLGDLTFDDYLEEGVKAGLDEVQNITDQSKINVTGYCVGGTLLGMAQSWLLNKNDKRINSLSFLTTLFDFSEPGEVGNYISEQMYPLIEQTVKAKGYFDGRILGLSFSLLRENNLFWSFFIENYLKGKDPTPFDILYWNSDSTNIPGEAYLFYLRNMYLENRLKVPQGVTAGGVALDLSKIKTPSYFLAAMADHIVLWPAAYRSAMCLGGKKRFVLTESGHVAGVVNPVDKGKYPHWVNDTLPESHSQWLAGARQAKGSWWSDWRDWLIPLSGELIKPPAMGKAIEKAPGSYVKIRLEPTVKASDKV